MEALQTALSGARLASVELQDHSWFFRFSTGAVVSTEACWRIVTDGRVVVSGSDHRQRFGLPAPVDAATVARRTLTAAVRDVAISPAAGDLRIEFGDGGVLEFLTVSSGYEGWHATFNEAPGGGELVSVGGGEVREVVHKG